MRKRWRWPVVAFVVGLTTFLHTLFDAGAWERRRRVRADLAGLTSKNQQLHEEAEALRGRIAALTNRPEVIARVARHELNLVEPDDVVFEIASK